MSDIQTRDLCVRVGKQPLFQRLCLCKRICHKMLKKSLWLALQRAGPVCVLLTFLSVYLPEITRQSGRRPRSYGMLDGRDGSSEG